MGELTDFTLSECGNYVSALTAIGWVNVWCRLDKRGRPTARGVWFARIEREARRGDRGRAAGDGGAAASAALPDPGADRGACEGGPSGCAICGLLK